MINPVQLARSTKIDDLKSILMNEEHEELKVICKKYTPDTRGLAYKWKSKDRLIEYIAERSYLLAAKGEVFIK